MQPWVRWVVLAAAAVAIAVLFVVLRPDDEEGAATPSPSVTATASPEPTSTGSPTETASPSPEPEVTRIEVTVQGDQVRGPARPAIPLDEPVLLIVRADVADHVHVHGYDLMADVSPGHPARIRFRADVPGVFEVELEDAGRLLLELEIAP
jgi:heme/copper-type cytochrome/quinol oxidase subunit 2